MRAAISVVLILIACKRPAPAAGQSSDQTLRVPDGFKVSVFAENLPGVRYLVLGPGNAVYASQPSSGLVVKLADRNNDGVADTVTTIVSGLHGPFGLAFRGDTLYVAEERDVVRFSPSGGTPVTVVPRLPGGTGHSTRTLLFGPPPTARCT